VEGVIEERLLRLDKEGRETLALGSVEGQRFTAEVIAQIRKADDREVVRSLSTEMNRQHRLVSAAGVERAGGRRLSHYQFRHSIFQKYLYEGLDEAERSYLHEDVGNVLEMLYEAQLDDVAVQLARHFAIAGIDPKAARYHRRAGELAAARYAHDEAVGHFTQALALTPDLDTTARCQLLLAREAVYNWQGRRIAQAADLAELDTLAAATNDRRVQAEVSLRQANYARLTGDYAAAHAHGLQAVMRAEAVGEAALEAQAYALLGLVSRQLSAYGEARSWLEMALELARDMKDASLVAQITYFLGLNQFSAHHIVDAQRFLEAAQEAYRALDSSQGEANCLLLLGGLHAVQGDLPRAVSDLRQALELCRRIGWRAREALILGDLGGALSDLGDYPAARSCHLQALEIAREVGDRESQAVSLDTLGLISHQLGQHADALESFHQALAIQRDIRDRRGEAYTLTHLGHALCDGEDLSAANNAFAQALSIRRSLDTDSGATLDDLAGLARVALAAGQLTQATKGVEEILAWIETHGTDGIESAVLVYLVCYRVLQAAAKGRPADVARARDVLQQGVDLLQHRTAAVADPVLRRQMLEAVPCNRELMAAWTAVRE
jgi:tetratricopeptide (TPR) repeat protein